MAEDMQSFSLKTEAMRRWLRNQDEEDAYLRAIVHLAGTKGNHVPDEQGCGDMKRAFGTDSPTSWTIWMLHVAFHCVQKS